MKVLFDFSNLKILFSSIVTVLIITKCYSQTGVLVTYYDGSQQGYSIAESGKLYFSNSDLMISTSEAATPTSIPISIIRKLIFSSSVVPLQLADFFAKSEKNQVLLTWNTTSEIGANFFVIERSADGLNYESLGQVAASKNLTGSSYNYVDGSPKNGIAYYRLKMVDADGKYVYSKTVMLNRANSVNITLLPNPANSYFTINASLSEKANVKIYSTTGMLMLSGSYAVGEQIDISKLLSGMYIVMINSQPYKLIKQ